MQELVKKVTESAGVTDEQAKTSIETISAYLKEKMPNRQYGKWRKTK